MCDACYDNPMKRTIVEGDDDGEGKRPDRLLVPESANHAPAPAIEGWELKEVNWNYFDSMESGVAKTFVYEQKTLTFFIVPYMVYEQYGGPVTVVKSEIIHAEAICRSLNRLARKEQDGGRERWAPRYPRLQFAVDRWPGQNEDLTRHHYC